MLNYIIRQATLKDIPAIERLHVQLMRFERNELSFCSNPRWPSTAQSRKNRKLNVSSPNGYLKVVMINDKIVGFAQGWVSRSQPWRMPTQIAELWLMYVDPKFRAQGIGKALMKDFIAWAKTKKAKRLTLIVVSNNQRAIRFYKKSKFHSYFMNMERDI